MVGGVTEAVIRKAPRPVLVAQGKGRGELRRPGSAGAWALAGTPGGDGDGNA
ncbi:MAG: hypothetical protein HY575_08460 [candidate division NC10 bacterium]|nr:hypothetical protein [candidate division NC10 bacterium]